MAIIGLSGYIGVGKDTVGKIIQDLTSERIARDDMGSGYQKIEKWEIKKFAGKLKQIAGLLTGISIEKFEDQEFKKTFLGEEWYYGAMRMSVREFLQKLGTEAIRDGLHQNAWVNALFADYKVKRERCTRCNGSGTIQQTDIDYDPCRKCDGTGETITKPDWIITDVRFPNEAQAIKDRGGIIVRINRFQKHHTSVGLHPSETSLDKWGFDEVIDNNGTIDDLKWRVKDMLIRRNFI